MSVHTLLASNALNNQIIAEIPFFDGHHSRMLNDNGASQFTVALDDPGVAALQLIQQAALEPAAIALYCRRDQTFEWGGLLWSHTWNTQDNKLTLNAAEFGSYMAARYIAANLTVTDDIANQAAAWCQAVFGTGTTYAGLNFQGGGPPLLVNVTTTGTQLTTQFNSWELHNVLDLMRSYQAQSPGGIDWAFDVGIDGNGNPCAQLTISYPRRGVSYVNSGIVFEFPGQVTKYDLTRDADPNLFTNDLIVTGAGAGATQLQAEVAISSAGHVKLTHVISDPNLSTQAAVSNYAAGAAAQRSGSPARVVNATLAGDAFFQAGVTVGDEVTFHIQDPYYPQGGLVPARITGYDVVPQTASAPELVTLTLGPVL